MTKLELVELIALIVVAIGIGIYYLVKAIRNHWLSEISSTIEAAIAEAEKSGKTGAEKKAMVIEAVKQKCIEIGIPYELIKKLISRIIDRIIKDYNVIKKGA